MSPKMSRANPAGRAPREGSRAVMGATRNGGIRLRSSTDDEAWDDLVAGHANGTAFHRAQFLRTVGPLLGLQVDLAIAEADGAAVGVVPMLLRSVGPFVVVNHALPFP